MGILLTLAVVSPTTVERARKFSFRCNHSQQNQETRSRRENIAPVAAAFARRGEFRHVSRLARGNLCSSGGTRQAAMQHNGAVEEDTRRAEAAAPLKLEEFLPYRLNVLASL